MSVLVGKKAPLFEANAVVNGGEFVEKFSLEQFIGKKHVVFFFYPLDFTFVCPTEIIAFQERMDDFEKRNVAVVGCSVDSHFSHWAWFKHKRKMMVVSRVLNIHWYPIFLKQSLRIMTFLPDHMILMRMVKESLMANQLLIVACS